MMISQSVASSSVAPVPSFPKSGHECPEAEQTIDLYDSTLQAVNRASFGEYRKGRTRFNVYNSGQDKVVETTGRPLVEGIGKGFKSQKFTLKPDGEVDVDLGGARPHYTCVKAYYHTSLGRGLVKAVSSSSVRFTTAGGKLTMDSSDRTDYVPTALHTYWFHGVDPEEWSHKVTVNPDGSAVANDGAGNQEYPAK